MAEFSKDELLEIIHIQQKTSAQLEQIVGALASCAEKQNRIIDIVESNKAIIGGCNFCRKNVENMTDDIKWIKILLGATGLVVMVATVILKATGH